MSQTSSTQLAASSIWLAQSQQRMFRQLVNLFSYPARAQQVADEQALLAVVSSLLDPGTGLADPHSLLPPLAQQRLACQPMSAEQAPYVIYPGHLPVDFNPNFGTLSCPEQGATLILSVKGFASGKGLRARGPGIAQEQRFQVEGLHPSWLALHQLAHEQFPMGVDLLLVSEQQCLAIPRTLRLTEELG